MVDFVYILSILGILGFVIVPLLFLYLTLKADDKLSYGDEFIESIKKQSEKLELTSSFQEGAGGLLNPKTTDKTRYLEQIKNGYADGPSTPEEMFKSLQKEPRNDLPVKENKTLPKFRTDNVYKELAPMLISDIFEKVVTVAIIGEQDKYLNMYKLDLKSGENAINRMIAFIDTDFTSRDMDRSVVLIPEFKDNEIKVFLRNKFGVPTKHIETHKIIDIKPKEDLL